MIQRSVWVGPSPLPKDFVEYLREIGLKGTVRDDVENGYVTVHLDNGSNIAYPDGALESERRR